MGKREIVSLQILRGIAAVAVVCHHSIRAVTLGPTETAFGEPAIIGQTAVMAFGASGVDIFFILSGFLMVFISAPFVNGTRSVATFLIQRLIRIWPLYAVITSVVCILLLVALLRKGAPAFDLQWYRLGSFFFIPSFAENGLVQPILGIGWTLNYEMTFYLAFAVALLIGKKHLLLTLTLVLLALNAIGMSLPSNSAMSAFLSNTIMFEFIIGAAIATTLDTHALRYHHPALFLFAGVAVLMIAAVLPEQPHYRFLINGSGAASIFIAMLQLEGKVAWPRFVLAIGNASYSIYLVHIVVIYSLCMPLLRRFAGSKMHSVQPEVAALGLVIASVIVGLLCHYLLEKPLLRWCNRLMRRQTLPASTTAVA